MDVKAESLLLQKYKYKERDIFEINWDSVLIPYREGGTEGNPVRRTWGTLIRWLMDKHKFDAETVGAAALMVAIELTNGKEIHGKDNSYGAKGDALARYIRNVCLMIREKKMQEAIFLMLGKKIYAQIEPAITEKIKRSLELKLPWYKRILRIRSNGNL